MCGTWSAAIGPIGRLDIEALRTTGVTVLSNQYQGAMLAMWMMMAS